mmetsp:Transcript_11367/g.17128  ORF Transcript_11367/g.17128 Transcript_11367/m.17128 type:complete len:103 (-) Transcript_11367:98-406(-)
MSLSLAKERSPIWERPTKSQVCPHKGFGDSQGKRKADVNEARNKRDSKAAPKKKCKSWTVRVHDIMADRPNSRLFGCQGDEEQNWCQQRRRTPRGGNGAMAT